MRRVSAIAIKTAALSTAFFALLPLTSSYAAEVMSTTSPSRCVDRECVCVGSGPGEVCMLSAGGGASDAVKVGAVFE